MPDIDWTNKTMIDFVNNTYYLTNDELDEAITILKQYPEYKGYWIESEIKDKKWNYSDYKELWEHLKAFKECSIIYLDNDYVTARMLRQHPDMVKLAEVYDNSDYIQHEPQPLLPRLRQINKTVMIFE